MGEEISKIEGLYPIPNSDPRGILIPFTPEHLAPSTLSDRPMSSFATNLFFTATGWGGGTKPTDTRTEQRHTA